MDDDQGSRKRWYALMALAILLHVFAMTNSDLGLDAHVRLNAAMDGQHDGQDLAWGKLRVADSTEQAPTHEQVYDGYIAPWFESELAAKFTAFVGVLCVACLAGFLPLGRASATVRPHEASLDSLQSNFLVRVGTWLRRGSSGLGGGIRNSWISLQSR